MESFLLRFSQFLKLSCWVIGCVFLFNSGNTCLAQGSIDHSFNSVDKGFGYSDGANNTVYTLAKQPNGKILIGGNFTYYNGISSYRIGRINPDGSIDNSFNTGTGANSIVSTISFQPDGKIIAGGDFSLFNGNMINRLVRLNNDGSVDFSFNTGSGANSFIGACALQPDGKIIIGGNFTSYNGIGINRIARINSDGSLDTSFNPGTGPDDRVLSVTLQQDGRLIISGAFTSVNGTSFNYLARLNADGSTDNSFNIGTGANQWVYATAVQPDGKIIVGGYFYTFNGFMLPGVLRLHSNGSVDQTFIQGSGANGNVTSLSIQSDGKIVVGGNFTQYNGISINKIMRLNANGSVDQSFNAAAGPNLSVQSLTVLQDGRVLIGGSFTFFNEHVRNRLALIKANGEVDNSFNNGSGASNLVNVAALQPDNKIIIGGAFIRYNDVYFNRITRLEPDGTPDTTYNPGSGASHQVRTVSIQSDGKQIIGGDFSTFDGIASPGLVRLNANGSRDSIFNVGTGASSVRATAMQPDGKIIIGGNFLSYNGTFASCIARLNSDGSLDTTFDTGLGANSPVLSIVIQTDGKIIIGGSFGFYNNISRNYIARLNQDGSLDTTFNPGSGFNNSVYTLSIQQDGKIFVGGNFFIFNGVSSFHVARLNPDGSRDTSFIPGSGASGIVYDSKIQSDGKLIIAGGFASYNSINCGSLARLNADGSLDSTFDTGVGSNGAIYTAALQPDGKIIIGGSFTSYNGTGRNRLARILNCTSGVSYESHIACDSFTWIDGNTYTSNNNTALFNVPGGAANGCDSVITLNLTILNAPFIAVQPLGSVTFCQGDSVVLSVQSNATTYQWIRNGVAVPNGNGISFVAKSSGRYRCIGMSSNGCADTSNTIFVSVPCMPLDPAVDRLHHAKKDEQFNVKFFPNPVNNILNIVCPEGELNIHDSSGRLILNRKTAAGIHEIDVSGWSPGIYHVVITDLHHQLHREKISIINQ